MLDYNIICTAKEKLPIETQKNLENRAKNLLDQIVPLQFSLKDLRADLYQEVAQTLDDTYMYNDDGDDYESVRELFTSNDYIANVLSKAQIRTFALGSGHIIACPSSSRDGLLFHIEIGLMLTDHKDEIDKADELAALEVFKMWKMSNDLQRK
jgi:hypothetical protein